MHRPGGVFQCGLSKGELLFADASGTSEQSIYPEQKLVEINRFYHVIVRSGLESGVLVINISFCRDDQNRQLLIGFPETANQAESIHSRHHYIGNHQSNVLLLQNLQCVFSILCRKCAVGIALQSFAKQISQVVVIFYYQNLKHISNLPFLCIGFWHLFSCPIIS